MNHYVIKNLKEHGGDFVLLKIHTFFPYFRPEIKFPGFYVVNCGFKYRKFLGVKHDFRVSMCFRLHDACLYSFDDLVYLIIELHKHEYIMEEKNFWNYGLSGACQTSRPNLITLMKKLGATKCEFCLRAITSHP